MRKSIIALLLPILLCSLALAHGGGTDAQGGHYNAATGKYHYHHGYPAHDHPNGVCPYDFDDKTGQSSGTSSGSSSTASTSTAKTYAIESDKYSENSRYIATGQTALRFQPSFSSASLGGVPKYAHLTASGLSSGLWVQVTYLDTTGWIHSGYLKPSAQSVITSSESVEKEFLPMTFKNAALLVGAGFVMGMILLLIYRSKVLSREGKMTLEARERERQAFVNGRSAAESDLKKRESDLKNLESQINQQKLSLRTAERAFRIREEEFFEKAQRLKAELPPKDEIIRVKVTDRWGYRTLYHRLDAPCVKHAETITLQTAHELHLLPCKRCKPDDQELIDLPPRPSLPSQDEPPLLKLIR